MGAERREFTAREIEMTSTQPIAPRHSTLAVIAIIAVGVLCALLANTLPVYLEVLAKLRAFTDSQTGLVAMADMGSYTAGIIGCAALQSRTAKLNWRQTALVGLLLLILGNVISIGTTGFLPFLLIRVLAGIGAGIATAIVYAVLAEGDAARHMAFLSVAMLMSGSVSVPYFAPLVAQYGASGLFGLLALLGVIAAFLTPLIPTGSAHHQPSELPAQTPSPRITPQGWLALLSVLLHWTGIGAIFAFISSMGTAWGGTPETVDLSVAKMLFAGMLGVSIVAVVGSRFGSLRSLIISYVGLLSAIAIFLLVKPVAAFLIVTASFGFIYNLMIPYQFEVVTKIDDSSGVAMLMSAAMLGGIAIGPAIAGYLVTADYQIVNLFSLFGCTAGLGLLLVAWFWHRRSTVPQAARSR
jgi:predicted MFS family arabinose efflux permease